MHAATGWFFVVLPDRDEAAVIAARLGADTRPLARFPSGRPWLVGRLPREQVVVNPDPGPNQVAVVGFSSATSRTLRTAADRITRVEHLDSLAHKLAGSFHLVASCAGQLRVQGSASGVRRVHHATVDGVVIACDRADVLAEIGGFPLDEGTVALRLLRRLPHPLAEQPLWSGVHPVPSGSCLVVDTDGRRARTLRWWSRPAPERSRVAGAVRLRQALADAVATRTAAGGIVHCDLSGGLDSTPLCYLAAQGPATVLAHTAYNDDPGGRDDLSWARRALPAMPQVRHETTALDELPAFFEGLDSADHRLDEPSQAYLAGPRMDHNIARARALGARAYLTGLGGDHLLRGMPVSNHTLFRRHPLLAWRRLSAARLMEARPLPELLRGLLDNRSYRRWLRDEVGTLARPRPGRAQAVRLDWDLPLAFPRWMTAEARWLVTQRLRTVAAAAEPLGETRAAHAEYATVLDGSHILRGAQQIGAAAGVALESPFFDDRVVEACFSVRYADREAPTEFKPLIKEAMRDALPAEFLARSTKTAGAPQAVRGLSAHWDEVLALYERSPLAGLGFVDGGLLRRWNVPNQHRPRDGDLDSTINCAAFLLAQQRCTAGSPTAEQRT